MSMKKCPSCGKKVAARSSYCIYCAARFDEVSEEKPADITTADATEILAQLDMELDSADETQAFDVTDSTDTVDSDALADTVCLDDSVPSDAMTSDDVPPAKISKLWLVISLIAFVLIAVLILLLILHFKQNPSPSAPLGQENPPVTTTTVSPETQAWLNGFLGQWVDEQSAGKKDLLKQGGQMLVISDITNNIVSFDLYSHSGGELHKTAFVAGVQAVLYDDTLHFTFDNDGLGQSGEGFLQLHDGGVNAEVLIKNISPDSHSLAMNTVFVRQSLPVSEGADIHHMNTQSSLEVFGEPVSDPVTNPDQSVTYEYKAGFAVVNTDSSVRSITIGYDRIADQSAYCFDSIDGTMTYDTVKAYYGDAEQDYDELDTNIFVLRYPLSGTSSVTFTFDGTSKLLRTVHYIF